MAYFSRYVYVLLAAETLLIIVTMWVIYLHQFNPQPPLSCSTKITENPTKALPLTTAPWSSMIAELMSAKEIYEYLHWTNSISCLFAVDFGFFVWNGEGVSAPDGHKAICLDKPISPVFEKCLVYSFGIGNQWSFDKSMSEYGCQVYSFDPSMGDESHDESEQVHFYNLGLAGKNGLHPRGWEMKTASSIYESLVHRHGTVLIDVLKLDIEFFEWEVIPQMMQSGFLAKRVKQLAVEIHFNESDPLETFQRQVRILQNLESTASSTDDGRFVRFSSRPNPWLKRRLPILEGKEEYIGLELAWYNSRYYSGDPQSPSTYQASVEEV